MSNDNMDSPYKDKIITIPNILSLFRIVLLPVFVVLYLNADSNWEFLRATLVLGVSALTDLLDGKIARKYNMISDFGKALDPVADKLTHVTIAFCLCWKIPQMTYVFVILVVKELCMMFLALYGTFRKNKRLWDSAQWYGKVCTTIVFVVFIALVLFPTMPNIVINILLTICVIGLVGSLIMYIRMFIQLNSKHSSDSTNPDEKAEDK